MAGIFRSSPPSCSARCITSASTLHPAERRAVYGWRTPLTLPFLTLFMALSGDWRKVDDTLGCGSANGRSAAGPAAHLPALLGGAAVVIPCGRRCGKALDVSLGYFLLPLTMVLAGRLIYRDGCPCCKNWRLACAMVGVGNELYQAGGAVADAGGGAGHPLYFILRRRFRHRQSPSGLW
ncbi:hypothetical protein M8494_05420 [Serratia ureilytica]